MIGQTISHYTILEKLGEGGMGVVYKAEDTKLDRFVALKFLPHGIIVSEEDKARFLQEAKAASAVMHPNVCVIHDIQEYQGQQFIVMEYIDGKTLRQMVPVQKMQTAIDYAIQIGEALQEAHSKGIVHRDVKTDNIMVNSKNQIKVMDFGLAKLKGSLKLTKTSSTVGTLAYMAPEQIQGGEVDVRSDIFSFGVVLYEMLTGHLPFRSEHEAAMVYSIVNEEPTPIQKYLPETSSELMHILNRALEKEPGERYQSVAEMLIDLRRVKRQTSKVYRGIAFAEEVLENNGAQLQMKPTLRLLTNRRLMMVMGAALLVLAAGAGYLLLLRTPGPGALHTLAVLPFRDLVSQTADESWGVPMTDVIISRLTSLKNLIVRPTSAVLKYVKAPSDPKQVGRELEVESVLDGTYQRVGGVIRVSVQLVDCGTQSSRWAQTYDLRADNMLRFQDEVAQKVVDGLSVQITDAEKEDLTRPMTNSPEAYNLFLEAQSYSLTEYGSSQAENLHKMQHLLLEAVAKDPNFAQAYACLSAIYIASYFHEGPGIDSLNTRGKLVLAQEAAETALKIDPQLGSAFTALGGIYMFQRRFEESNRNFQKAINLAPNAYNTWYLLGFQYHFCGMLDQAERAFRRSVELNPTYDLSVCWHAQLLLYLGRSEEAEQVLRRRLAASPDAVLETSYLGELLYYDGKIQEARPLLSRAAEKWWPAGAPNPLFYEMGDFAGFLYASLGKREKIDARFFKLKPEMVYDGIHAFRKTSVYALLGDKENAIAWFRRAVDLGYNNYPWFERDKNLDKLRDDTRFQQILLEVKAHWERYQKLFGGNKI